MDAEPNNLDARPQSLAPSAVDEVGAIPVERVRFARLRRVPRRAWLFLAACAFLGSATSGSWWYTCGFRGCPTSAQLKAWRPTEGGALLDRDGRLIAPLAPVNRVNVSIGRIPKIVQASFVAVEDRRFYSHHGVDWHGVARAFVENVRALGVREGASTITMQLARNVFLSHRANERSLPRKLLEWRYAGLLEAALDKPAILERYLNAIYLGNGVYGVEGASRDLFGKSVKDVTLAEAALLAGLPKAPSSYTPRRSREKALQRRSVVLDVLEREGVATPKAIAAARATKISGLPREWTPPGRTDSWAVEMARVMLDSLRRIGAIPAGLKDAQLRVRSTFDRQAQFAGEKAVAAGAASVDASRGWWEDERPIKAQGALVALDPMSGAIRALVGGRRLERKGFNRAVRAYRQPGSAFKPFVYAAALGQGLTLASTVNDVPITIGEGETEWTPTNFDDSYSGRITVRAALARSANAATVRISQDVGIPRVIAVAHALGIKSELPDVPALALGAGNVSPLELTAAYAPFSNGGKMVQPYAIERVEDIFGRVLWSRPPVVLKQVLDPRDAFLMTSLLRSVVDEGTGRAVRNAGIRGPVAGKTGTTNGGTDVWFVGYSPSLVTAVWFGADDPVPLGESASGGRFAAPVWARFMREGWHSPDKDTEWVPPAGLESKVIDAGTGKRAGEYCGPSRREWFRIGTGPTASCEGDSRYAVMELPELAELPEWHDSEIHVQGVEEVVDAAINAIDDRRGRAAARKMIDELKKLAESQARRRRP
jgi:1A family penicillin-binding protein